MRASIETFSSAASMKQVAESFVALIFCMDVALPGLREPFTWLNKSAHDCQPVIVTPALLHEDLITCLKYTFLVRVNIASGDLVSGTSIL